MNRTNATKPNEKPMPIDLRLSVERIQENCEPALCTVLFMGGAGGVLGGGGGAHSVARWEGGRMVAGGCHRQSSAPDAVGQGRADAGHKRRRAGICLAGWRHHLHGGCYALAGRRLRLCSDAGAGCADRIYAKTQGLCGAGRAYGLCAPAFVAEGQYRNPSNAPVSSGTAHMTRVPQIGWLADGRRLHLQDGPIDLFVEVHGSEINRRAAYDAAARRFTGLLDELCD